jgi:hypothetical protein
MGQANPYPMADIVRERTALAVFPYLEVDVEVWVAEHAHELVWFNFHRFRYRDPALEAWLGQVGAFLTSRPAIDVERHRYFSHP